MGDTPRSAHPGPARDFVGYGPDTAAGQPGRASALRDFIECALGCDGVSFLRRMDIAQFWTKAFPPPRP